MGRPLTRSVVSPVIADPLLMANVYDEARAGFYNVGRLTTSSNAAAVHVTDWNVFGQEAQRATTIAGITHVTTTGMDRAKLPLWTCYAPVNACAGSAASPIVYTASGKIKSVPGLINAMDYEADGQTRSVLYANG